MARLAHDSKAHRFGAWGKCGVCAQTVRDPYLGRSAPRAVQLDDDMIRTRFHRDTKTQAPWGAVRHVSKKPAATSSMKDGRSIAVDIDLAKFFDTVNHDVLMNLLGRTIADKRLLRLIGRYLRAGVLVGEHIEASEVGTPQGGPLSPLLANILLHQLDLELERRGHRFACYADDLIILVKNQRAAQRVMDSITRYIETTLRLKVNLAKSKVAPMSECAFLGFTIKGKKIRWTDKVLANFKHRIKELTGRSWGVSMEYRLKKLGQYLRGWTAYFGISQYYRPVPELDEWIRRRIRMCYWKQWRWARTKIKNLLALGVDLKSAQQQLLADVQNPGDQPSDIQRVAKGARFAQCEGPVVQGTGLHGKEEENFVERAALLNRPLRTRTVGGVGAGS